MGALYSQEHGPGPRPYCRTARSGPPSMPRAPPAAFAGHQGAAKIESACSGSIPGATPSTADTAINPIAAIATNTMNARSDKLRPCRARSPMGEFSLSANDRPALGATVAETGVLECDWSHSETGVSEHESEGRDSPRLRANSNELILLLDVQENWRPDLDLNQAMRPCTVPASPLRHRAVARGRTAALANKVNGLG